MDGAQAQEARPGVYLGVELGALSDLLLGSLWRSEGTHCPPEVLRAGRGANRIRCAVSPMRIAPAGIISTINIPREMCCERDEVVGLEGKEALL